MSPRAMARSAVWMPAPSTVSGAVATRSRPSPSRCQDRGGRVVSVAIGFSLQTCLPGVDDLLVDLGVRRRDRQVITIETSSRARSSSTVPDAATP